MFVFLLEMESNGEWTSMIWHGMDLRLENKRTNENNVFMCVFVPIFIMHLEIKVFFYFVTACKVVKKTKLLM